MSQKIVWTVAGSDSSGYAGIHNDFITFHQLGVHGCSVLTANTAQNQRHVQQIAFLSEQFVAAQWETLQDDLPANAIKLGMLGTVATIEKIKYFLASVTCPVVLDPVLHASSGNALYENELAQYLQSLKALLPLVDIVTPNLHEAEQIVQRDIRTHQDMVAAAEDFLSLGAKSVLIKGGHLPHDVFSQDYWTNGSGGFWLANKRWLDRRCRGTGCALSSALAACLALGYNIKDALVVAKMFVHRGIRLATTTEGGVGLFHHAGWPETAEDLPYLSDHPLVQLPTPFQPLPFPATVLYPIVDSLAQLRTLLPLGYKIFQLRVKNKNGVTLEKEIQHCVALCKQYAVKLFINDYWELAIRYGADGVHLGQEDIMTADIERIRQAGVYVGVSTHCYYEVARAHTLGPSYVACGPIFPTTSKIMSFSPQGVAQLARWQRTLPYPLVAIGGINMSNLADVLATGVAGVAMISAITQSDDPIAISRTLLNKVEAYDAHR